MLPDDIRPYPYSEDSYPDYHAVVSIQLIELINDGVVDFNEPEWDYDYYSKDQRDRVYEKVVGRFGYREIGIIPIKEWHARFIALLNEIMPKYKPLYEALEKGVDITQVGGEYNKTRDIYSDFPQTMLSGDNQDYASTGQDHEHETIHTGAWVDVAEAIDTRYNDVDVMILNKLERMFTPLITVNMNGY